MGHAGLVTHKGSQVGLLGGIVLGKGLDLALATTATLLGQKAQRAVAGVCGITGIKDK